AAAFLARPAAIAQRLGPAKRRLRPERIRVEIPCGEPPAPGRGGGPARPHPDEAADLCLLADQDRARWDQLALAEGLGCLDRAAEGDTVTEYHLEAAIAARHAGAPGGGPA